MTPDQVRAALKAVEGEIIGMKTAGRRNYGTAYNARETKWPRSMLNELDALKRSAKEYRNMLAPDEEFDP